MEQNKNKGGYNMLYLHVNYVSCYILTQPMNLYTFLHWAQFSKEKENFSFEQFLEKKKD